MYRRRGSACRMGVSSAGAGWFVVMVTVTLPATITA
jgi:hypothetical protein